MSNFTHTLKPMRYLGVGLVLLLVSGCSLLPAGPVATAIPVATQAPLKTQTTAPAAATPVPSATSVPATEVPATATVAATPTLASAADAFGVLGDLTQGVSILPAPDGAAHPGEFGEALPKGAQLDTDATGRARVLLNNGTTVRLMSNTQLLLSDRQQPTTGNLLTTLNMLVGKVFVILGRNANETLTVDTPIGVGAVRGSFMSVEYAPGKPDDPTDDVLIVTCLEGDCSISEGTTTVALTTGEKAFIQGKGGPITGPDPMTQDDVNDWLANNPEILILFGLSNGTSPQSGGPITLQLPGGGVIIILPAPTSTATPTPTPTATSSSGGGGSTLPTAAPAAGLPWPNTLGGRPDGLAVVFFGLVLGVAGRGWLKRRRP